MVRESQIGERRVGIAPPSISALTKLGFEVLVERGAGEASGYADDVYEAAGASLVDEGVWEADVVVKVRPPTDEEVERLREGAVLVSLIYPARNEGLVEKLAARKVTVIALDRVPRITRAQSMDVLSSMANLAGYRAVLEAASSTRASSARR